MLCYLGGEAWQAIEVVKKCMGARNVTGAENMTGVHWQKGEMSWLVNWQCFPKRWESSEMA